ncbi:hypothetical protein CHL78_001050 [Romboutsia weinsteinii]|uniref:Uncharacterized protein n=1 Tax=Romboutsia weinsteinii TaxID=2020949 RepID=A0A371JAV7_9FIRM|nr:hypothetical protein [Romboutsia weinsteinii]RDY29788.1 hypothetical protein CHL78_001050 [Romboutsia weinsteinii]
MFFIDISIRIDVITFNIYTMIDKQKEYLLQDNIVIPKSFSMGRKLSYIRTIIDTLINQYNIEKAYIETEDIAGSEIIDIVKTEGVIEELFSNCGVEICK